MSETDNREAKGYLDKKGEIYRSRKAAITSDLHAELKCGACSTDLVNRLIGDARMRRAVIELLEELEK